MFDEIKIIIQKISDLGFFESAEDLLRLLNLEDNDFENGCLRIKQNSVQTYYEYLQIGNYFDVEPELTLFPNGNICANWFLKNPSGTVVIEFKANQKAEWGFTNTSNSFNSSFNGTSNLSELNRVFHNHNLYKY